MELLQPVQVGNSDLGVCILRLGKPEGNRESIEPRLCGIRFSANDLGHLFPLLSFPIIWPLEQVQPRKDPNGVRGGAGVVWDLLTYNRLPSSGGQKLLVR